VDFRHQESNVNNSIGSINGNTQTRIFNALSTLGSGGNLNTLNNILRDVPRNTIRGSLTKLAARGVVEKAGGGVWRVVDNTPSNV
jgi:hypothetical protein